ncbi:sigma-70 family RNA polymerase sigma factor [Caenimonas koreensis DSM 17982]|uniref:Sigma-70 family RNA polymerase sigma factor n=1 Tax=Caenimonas koreensis DSM 17982 TaxID=1121255 RepID=A0A844AX86_9BURK|nr:sigma-70 family RNA polymerase sigma factor [Caenimonas koreensis]MRD48674.1 sigma-70 family RNA polymerase sigma factor [Caenimonas koreensis DSM 17982]
MEPSESALWRQFREHGDSAAREALLAMHLPYAKVVAAAYFGKRIDNDVPFEDYRQMASLALIEALERFDPAVGVMFKTYAARYMHGAILDGLQRANEKHEQLAARRRLLAQRRASLRGADDSQGARKTATRRRTPEQALAYVAEVGIGFAIAWLLDGTGMVQPPQEAIVMPAYCSMELRQLRERIVELVQTLPAGECRVIQAHYFQAMGFEEVANLMGLSRSRISQLHRQGLMRLKESLHEHLGMDVSA